MGLATKPSKEPSVVNFDFAEIPLEEAVNAVIAGDGNYALIKAKLLEALPHLPEGKAFAFGSPDGQELEEDQRRGICLAVNATLKKAKLPWRTTYSGVKKLFVCVPSSTPKTYQKKESHDEYVPRSKWNDDGDEAIVRELYTDGMSVAKIAAKTKIAPDRVRYLCYQKFYGQPRKKFAASSSTNGKSTASPPPHPKSADLVNLAKLTFGYTGDFSDALGKKLRKAISIVGMRDMNLAPKELGPLVGISGGGVYFNAHSKGDFALEEVAKLRKALNHRGGR